MQLGAAEARGESPPAAARSPSGRLPNFLVIGAQKCGTTWLAEMLRQHPEVFTPARKELHYFNRKSNYAQGLAWYQQYFAEAGGHKAVGECTPNYLWVQEACPDSIPSLGLRLQRYDYANREVPRLVHEVCPDARLLVVLRNPVDRAISSHRHHIRMRRISPRSRILEVGGQFGIVSMGFYAEQLQAWEAYFPRDRFLVLIYEEDVRREPERALRRVFEHLEVDPEFKPGKIETRFNESSSDAYMFARYYAPRLTRRLFKAMPALERIRVPGMGVSNAERAELARVYAAEVDRLESHLGRRLDCWREERPAR